MTDPKIRKVEKVTLSSVKNKNEKVMVRSTFARAFQVCGEKFSTKSAKLSGILQINRLFGTTWFIYRAEFWKYILMDGELGGETYIDVLLVSSALSPPISTLIGIDDFYTNLVWKKLVFLSFRGYLGEIESKKKKSLEFFLLYFFFILQFCVGVSAPIFQVLIRKRWR